MRTALHLLLLIFSVTGISAQQLVPASTTGHIIEHTYFTLSYSETHEQAEWVYYELTPDFINGSLARTDDFRRDTDIKTGSAQLEDYQGSGFDRGNLCPAGDLKLNRVSMSESFLMANMSPQTPI
jgi:endonuclease G, mitochondrial